VEIRELQDRRVRREAVPILQQLWSDAEPNEILEWTGDEDYRLFGRFVEGELVGVAGLLMTNQLHHIRHAWLYDLVVDGARRGQGHGSALVDFAEHWAKERGCETTALASPLSKEGTHQYYENGDYERWGYVIEKRL
jgi:GNAT superfamily N-acetyltransferase